MIFYAIELKSQPKIIFANSVTHKISESSKNIIDHRTDIIELSVNTSCDKLISSEHGDIVVPKGAITVYMPDCRYEIKPYNTNEYIFSSNTVAIKSDGLGYIRYNESDPAKICDILDSAPSTIFLPQVFIPMNGHTVDTETEQYFLSLLKALIFQYANKSASGSFLCLSKWYELCAFLDLHFRDSICQMLPGKDRQSFSNTYYLIYKIKKYINSHLTEPINIAKIADNLQLTSAYIGKLFSQSAGLSITDYINRQRVFKLCAAIDLHDKRKFSELAREAGFADFRYAQRKFKKITGVSMREYSSMSNGLTLYHTNPWIMDNIDKDIFTEK